MKGSCPSELDLEIDASAWSAHTESCAQCSARLVRRREADALFDRVVYPRTEARVVERHRRRGRWLQALWFAPLPLAAACLFLVFHRAPVTDDGPSEEYVGRRGAGLTFNVYAHTSQGTQRVRDGGAVPADAALRFEVNPASPCWVTIFSVEAGKVTKLFPPDQDSQRITDAGALPGGAMLDGVAGPERLFAVCTVKPVKFDDLLSPLTNNTGPGSLIDYKSNLHSPVKLPGLDDADFQATMLLEKQR